MTLKAYIVVLLAAQLCLSCKCLKFVDDDTVAESSYEDIREEVQKDLAESNSAKNKLAGEEIDNPVVQYWQLLATPGFAGDGCVFHNYFPEGALRTFYCSYKHVIDLPTLEKMAGTRVFAKGPHQGRIELESKNSFGHYSHHFLDWVQRHVVPVLTSDRYRKIVQPIFSESPRRLARLYLSVYNKLKSDSKSRLQFLRDYKSAMAAGKEYDGPPDFGLFTYTENLQYVDDGNVGHAAVKYWLRRYIDGTHDRVAKILETLVKKLTT